MNTRILPFASIADINAPATTEVELACKLQRHGTCIMEAALSICTANAEGRAASERIIRAAGDAAAEAVMAISHFHARKS